MLGHIQNPRFYTLSGNRGILILHQPIAFKLFVKFLEDVIVLLDDLCLFVSILDLSPVH